MIRHRQKQLYAYSLFWGIVSFFVGFVTTYSILPETLIVETVPQWKVSAWVWLSAHGLPIAEQAVSGSPFDTGNLDFIQPNPELHLLRVIPLFLVILAGVLVVNDLDGFGKDTELLEITFYAAGAYVIAGLITIVVSEAQPGITLIVLIMIILAGSAYIGSSFASKLPIPIFAITSISGLVGIGLLVVLGLGAVLTILIPFGKYGVAGALGATVALWVGKNIEV